MRRLYKSGTTWCVWRWTEVDSGYITRLHLIKTPWFAVCLRWLNKPDPEPHLHDHPVTFLSLILRGGYAEYRGFGIGSKAERLVHRWYNYVKAGDRHSIVKVLPGTLTLAFMGPKVREWGFHTEGGWVTWKDYYTKQRSEKASK